MSVKRNARLGLGLVMVMAAAGGARADGGGVGLFTPSAPFEGPVARLDFVSGLAARLGPGYVGRSYARATDFVAAVKRGEIRYAVVDATFLAALGTPYTVLAEAQRGGATSTTWEVVTQVATARSLVDLKGKVIAVPAIGAREEAFLFQVLLEGELPREHFARVVYAPDTLSALASVEHGRADAAVVPAGLPLPPGAHRVAALGAIGWPVLVALPGVAVAEAHGVAQVAQGFVPSKVFDGFVAGGDDAVRALTTRFAHAARLDRRPPLAIPALRLPTAGLVGTTRLGVVRPSALTYIGASR
jgi:hypothetical protein